MSQCDKPSLAARILLVSRARFLTAGAAPVLVGSALGYAVAGNFEPLLFALALSAIILLQAGANMANDYFDHLSGNDQANSNPTPFSGGSRCIQTGIISPRATLLAALAALALAAMMGIAIVLLTGSLFILGLGLVGLLGGYFYTATPLKLGYRCTGEVVIFLLFGLLPVCGAYFLQTARLDVGVLLPGSIVGILVFLIILINEFPDAPADAAVNKKTLVVALGVEASIWIYRIALLTSYAIALAALLLYRPMFHAGLLYLLTLPLAGLATKSANKQDLSTPGRYKANQQTILLHCLGSLALTTGLVVAGLTH